MRELHYTGNEVGKIFSPIRFRRFFKIWEIFDLLATVLGWSQDGLACIFTTQARFGMSVLCFAGD